MRTATAYKRGRSRVPTSSSRGSCASRSSPASCPRASGCRPRPRWPNRPASAARRCARRCGRSRRAASSSAPARASWSCADRSDEPVSRELRHELRRRNVTFGHLHEALLDLRARAVAARRDRAAPGTLQRCTRSSTRRAPPRRLRRVEPARRGVPRRDRRPARQPGADARPRADHPAAHAGARPLHAHPRDARAATDYHRRIVTEIVVPTPNRRRGHAQAHQRLAHRLGETGFGSPPRDPRSLLHHHSRSRIPWFHPTRRRKKRSWASSSSRTRSPRSSTR